MYNIIDLPSHDFDIFSKSHFLAELLNKTVSYSCCFAAIMLHT